MHTRTVTLCFTLFGSSGSRDTCYPTTRPKTSSALITDRPTWSTASGSSPSVSGPTTWRGHALLRGEEPREDDARPKRGHADRHGQETEDVAVAPTASGGCLANFGEEDGDSRRDPVCDQGDLGDPKLRAIEVGGGVHDDGLLSAPPRLRPLHTGSGRPRWPS